MSTIALLTAGGVGSRMHQDIPKQFLNVDNKPILVYTLEAFQKHPSIDEICVAILKGWENILNAYANQFNITKLKYVVPGGATGQESICNGLKEIRKHHNDDDIVMIHDGNRPMVSQEIITNSLVTYETYGDAVAAIPCTEVVFFVDNPNSQVSMQSIERNNLRRTQTPHTYRLGDIINAQKQAKEKGITNIAACCSLMERLGRPSHFSLGSEKNLKITTREDIEIFKALLHSQNDSWIK
ncbi:IspD/TarI family cytidylyltransferase [Megasphaera elsdenii]|uniref:IspD/TarI family cytidylyltransferase n=1 Tax=Megasphaera elsdenii TaxID=907 RepID=UPI0039F4C6DF